VHSEIGEKVDAESQSSKWMGELVAKVGAQTWYGFDVVFEF